LEKKTGKKTIYIIKIIILKKNGQKGLSHGRKIQKKRKALTWGRKECDGRRRGEGGVFRLISKSKGGEGGTKKGKYAYPKSFIEFSFPWKEENQDESIRHVRREGERSNKEKVTAIPLSKISLKKRGEANENGRQKKKYTRGGRNRNNRRGLNCFFGGKSRM